MGSGLIQVDSESADRSMGISYWEKNDGRAKNDAAVFPSAHVIYKGNFKNWMLMLKRVPIKFS